VSEIKDAERALNLLVASVPAGPAHSFYLVFLLWPLPLRPRQCMLRRFFALQNLTTARDNLVGVPGLRKYDNLRCLNREVVDDF